MNLHDFCFFDDFDSLLKYNAKDLNFIKSSSLNDNINVYIPKNRDITSYSELFINNSNISNKNINIYLYNSIINCRLCFLGSNINFYAFTKYYFNSNFLMYDDSNVVIGENSTANSLECITANSDVFIGKDVMISHEVVLQSTDQHPIVDLQFLTSKTNHRDYINVEDHVWLGKRSMILKNINIGTGSIVGAGSVVTRNVLKFTAVAGNPVKRIKDNVSWLRNKVPTSYENELLKNSNVETTFN